MGFRAHREESALGRSVDSAPVQMGEREGAAGGARAGVGAGDWSHWGNSMRLEVCRGIWKVGGERRLEVVTEV